MGPGRTSPAERVRARLQGVLGLAELDRLPDRYQRVGRVLILRLPEELRLHYPDIAAAWCEELGVGAVLRRAGETHGELRLPGLERIAGDDTRTEVVEHGIRYRFDAATILFARGNKTERHRIGGLVQVGETVADLFAGIGYFTLPAAVTGQAGQVWAVEKNSESFHYLEENVRCNRVADRVTCLRGDNRDVELPTGGFDRVLLGYLPSSVGWIDRAVPLLRPVGGTLHVHLVVGHREGLMEAEGKVRAVAEQAGARVLATEARAVKAYGPGRVHAVVDLTLRRAR